MTKKRMSIFMLILILSFSFCITPVFSAETMLVKEEPFDVEGESAILIDASSGKILYEKNIHEKLFPASVTKIMVLLLAMEAIENDRISLDDDVLISENASGMGGSQMYLEAGEIQKVEHLIRAIALRSGNDCSVALAEHIAGSYESFIDMMNEKATELGMNNTHFVNSTGLHDENHYTTAYDISLMSKELLKHTEIHKWLSMWMSTVKVGKEKDVTQEMVNTNRLIHDYPGANGIKTGYTSNAGYCLSASATKGNLTLISVILKSPSSAIRNKESMKLLNYGFANYDSIPVAKKGELIKTIPISKGKSEKMDVIAEGDLSLLVDKGQNKEVEKEILLPDKIEAPVEKNSKVGEIVYKIDGEEKGRLSLLAKEEVKKASLLDMMGKVFSRLIGK
ncbi:D-alanyl-D-alanine carboxypeptidase family protein [Sporosalibacterium faouarense]|uniref:D-alanyl-D-alanine carboxypeptidase family protein n=1 Tax=Sporosalibacterium faouarense TaxID=516123 RepID=UPI00141C7358|nr:D-alanyl-D-alanine carboxypeptidase family protein [Sporosalibacterium faouarense]MTI48170.1 D-alanyl-D-alanine carboxypeptidase [Bacillota bacterium]